MEIKDTNGLSGRVNINKQAEMIRTYLRASIVIFFLGCFGFVLYKYVGVETGKIQPNVIYSWLTGLIMGFIAYYFTEQKI